MPSNALTKFENKMLDDVDRLVDSHNQLNPPGPGRRSLGHFTRSGVFMLCASWELYVEELAVEIATNLVDRANDPNELPLDARKRLSLLVKTHKDELMPLNLAGYGWRDVYLTHVQQTVDALNTPKSGPIDYMYQRLLGWESPSKKWKRGKNFIDKFVDIRGAIAHQGRDAPYVPIEDLKKKYILGISATVIDHDNAACDFIYGIWKDRRPWRRRSK